jgi:hypothetical protein
MLTPFYMKHISDLMDKRFFKKECIRKLTKHYESLNMKYVCDKIISEEELNNNREYKMYKDPKTDLIFVLKFDSFEHPDIGSYWYCKQDVTECFEYHQHSKDNQTCLLSYIIGVKY